MSELRRKCGACGQTKGVAEFNRQASGLHPWCRMCQAQYRSRYYAAHVTAEKSRTQQYYQAHSDALRAKRRERYRNNNAAEIEKIRIWQAANAERLREYRRRRNKLSKPWRRWRQENPEAAREAVRRYQARKAGASTEKVSYLMVALRDGWVCHLCRKDIERRRGRDGVHFDHVVPLSRGGQHTEGNIRVSHAECNLRKGARLLREVGGGPAR